MKLRKNKKPSFAPRKPKLDLKTKLEWIFIIIDIIILIRNCINYIQSKF